MLVDIFIIIIILKTIQFADVDKEMRRCWVIDRNEYKADSPNVYNLFQYMDKEMVVECHHYGRLLLLLCLNHKGVIHTP